MNVIKWDKPLALRIYTELSNKKGGSLKKREMVDAGYPTLPQKIVEYWGGKHKLDKELHTSWL